MNRTALAADLGNLLDAVNAQLEDHQRLAYGVVVRDAWTMANGFLTPTLKIRRNILEQRYLPQAETWQAQGHRVIWEWSRVGRCERPS